jgi:hypothetical protein
MPVGTTYRAVLTAFLSIPLFLVLSEVIPPVVGLYNTNHWLADALLGVANNSLAIALIGALMMIVAASVTQSRVRA